MPISSHSIPKAYLDGFATAPTKKHGSGLLWVYRRGERASRRATVIQGAERGYFGITRKGKPLDERKEKLLADLEGECLDTLRLANTRFIDLESPSRRIKLAFYAAMLFCRTTKRRNHVKKMWAAVLDDLAGLQSDSAFIENLACHYTGPLNEPVEPQRIRERLQKTLDKLQDPTVIRNDFVENVLELVDPLKELLLQKVPWSIWRTPDGLEFVTSDNPVITYVQRPNGELHPGFGFRQEGVTAIFPLGSHACLAMGDKSPMFRTLDYKEVFRINDVVVRMCDRYVYSKTFSEQIADMVSEQGGIEEYGKTAFVPVGIKRLTAKERLLTSLGLDPSLPL